MNLVRMAQTVAYNDSEGHYRNECKHENNNLE